VVSSSANCGEMASSSSSTISESSVFSVQTALLAPIISFGLALAIFGFYVFLFSLSTYFLYKGKSLFHRRIHIIWTTSIFLIGTLGALINAASGIQDAVVIYTALRTQNFDPFFAYVTANETQTAITGVTYTFLIVANCIADAVLIHRIYLVWGSNKWVVALPIVSSCAANLFGLSGAVMRTKGFSNSGIPSNFTLELRGVDYLIDFYYTNAAINSLLTLLIASRIWWVGRQTAIIFSNGENRDINRKYKTIVAVLLECGIIYPISLIAHAATEANAAVMAFPINLTPTVIQLAGIAPMLILLRTCLGRSLTDKIISSQATISVTSSAMRYPSQGPIGSSKNIPSLVNFHSAGNDTSLHSGHNLQVQIEMKS